ncbi:MAG: ATP-binding protein [Ignavibacteria bacterium]|nr:ATP-binding protein [Ignavibacteria bacterium]
MAAKQIKYNAIDYDNLVAIVNSMDCAFVYVNNEFKIVLANNQAKELIRNVKKGEPIEVNTDFFDYFSKEDIKKVKSILLKISRKEQHIEIMPFITKDKKSILKKVVYSPVFNDLNQVIGFTYQIFDQNEAIITEKYKLLTKVGRIGYWYYKPNTDEFYLSESLLELLNLKENEIPKKLNDWLNYLENGSKIVFLDFISNVLKHPNKIYEVEVNLSFISYGVESICIRGYFPTNSGSNGLKIIGSMTDVTNRNQSISSLNTALERYRNIFDNSSELYIIISSDGKVKAYNKLASLFTRKFHNKDLILDSNITEYLMESEREDFLNAIKTAFTGQMSIIERKYNNDGDDLWYEFRFIPLKDKSEKYKEIFIEAYDITKRKKDEEKLRESEARLNDYSNELEQINKRKDKFFSLVAHDLRSPFTGLLGLAEVLNSTIDTMSVEDIREVAKQIHMSAKQIYNLLENLLEWSRLQRGITKYFKVDIPVKNLVDKIINLYSNNAAQKNIKLESKIPPETIIKADMNMFELVVRNLISNAVKFTKHGGTVTVEYQKTSEYDNIIVKDTGVGMSEENARKLFEIDRDYVTKGTGGETGTGLGLILCKEHLDKNGGKISVKSKKGEGSTFVVSFPRT